MAPRLDHLLKHRCTIQRSTPQNHEGVIKPSWAEVASGVPCLAQETSGDNQKNEAGLTYASGAKIYFAAGVDIRPNVGQDQPDRIVMSKPPRMAGVIYKVDSVVDEAGQAHHLLARATRLPDLGPAT